MSRTRRANPVIEQLEHEARHILRTTRIDLDLFLSLSQEQRAERWQQWDYAAKFQAIAQMIERRGSDWDEDVVDEWIARYDARWLVAADLPPATEATAAELERLAEEHTRYAAQATAAGRADDTTFHGRAATAYAHALDMFLAGVRPQRLPTGAWLLPSSRPGGEAHCVRRAPGGRLVCNCSARAQLHWPIALLIGIEAGAEALDRAA